MELNGIIQHLELIKRRCTTRFSVDKIYLSVLSVAVSCGRTEAVIWSTLNFPP